MAPKSDEVSEKKIVISIIKKDGKKYIKKGNKRYLIGNSEGLTEKELLVNIADLLEQIKNKELLRRKKKTVPKKKNKIQLVVDSNGIISGVSNGSDKDTLNYLKYAPKGGDHTKGTPINITINDRAIAKALQEEEDKLAEEDKVSGKNSGKAKSANSTSSVSAQPSSSSSATLNQSELSNEYKIEKAKKYLNILVKKGREFNNHTGKTVFIKNIAVKYLPPSEIKNNRTGKLYSVDSMLNNLNNNSLIDIYHTYLDGEGALPDIAEGIEPALTEQQKQNIIQQKAKERDDFLVAKFAVENEIGQASIPPVNSEVGLVDNVGDNTITNDNSNNNNNNNNNNNVNTPVIVDDGKKDIVDDPDLLGDYIPKNSKDKEKKIRKERKDDIKDDTKSVNVKDKIKKIDSNGKGKGEDDGLDNVEITNMMSTMKNNNFIGCIANGEMDKLPLSKKEKFCFIMNTLPMNGEIGHWLAILIDRKKKTVEYFDPFGNSPVQGFENEIMTYLKKLGITGLMQFKVNRIRKQDTHASTCGYHAMKFLIDRMNGKSFMDATGFRVLDDSIKGEKEIKKFKEMIEPFENIKV